MLLPKRIFFLLFSILFLCSSASANFDSAFKLYEKGKYAEAFYAFKNLAYIGDKSSQFNLGVMYFRGEHVQSDPVEAYAWIVVAAEGGDESFLKTKKIIFRDRHAGYERSNREMWSSEREAKKLSPYKLVEDIEAPVLLIATEQHTSIDIKHSEGLYKKLKKNKKKVEFVKLEEKAGSSAGVTQDNELIKLQAIEAFLSENIGGVVK